MKLVFGLLVILLTSAAFASDPHDQKSCESQHIPKPAPHNPNETAGNSSARSDQPDWGHKSRNNDNTTRGPASPSYNFGGDLGGGGVGNAEI